MKSAARTWYHPYKLTLITLCLFVLFALWADTPREILQGLYKIITSRSLLVTDYIAVGGVGAALVNAAITAGVTTAVLMLLKIAPNGALIMAIWLTTGFSFFGKNLFNMLPITFGVWLYSKWQKEPFSSYSLVAILSTTLAPVVSELAFLGHFPSCFELTLGCTAGVATGFIMPVVAAATMQVHNGYNLYNIGFAGGILALFLTAILTSANITIENPLLWDTGNKLFLAVFIYSILLLWLMFGLFSPKRPLAIANWKKIQGHSGRLVSDYYLLYGDSIFFNMATLGLFATTLTLAMGAELNGASIAGIFTIMGFGAFGKHFRNCVPIMAGALLAALWNPAPHVDPRNITAILFSTGLAPIAGQFGWAWGVVAGVLHVTIVYHVGGITGGLNLYNNGFSAGFIALLLVPIITAFSKRRLHHDA